MRRHSIGLRLLDTYLSKPYEFYLTRNSSDMSKTILSEVDQVVGSVFRPVFNMVSYSLVLVAITVMLFIVNPWLALSTAFLFGIIYLVIYFLLRKKMFNLGNYRVEANKKRFLTTGQVLSGIKVIKLLGREKIYLNRFELPSKQFSVAQSTYQTLTQVPSFFVEALVFGAMLLLTIYLVFEAGGVDEEALGSVLPILGLYLFAAMRIRPAVHNIYRGFASLRFGKAAIDNLYDDLVFYNSSSAIKKVSAKKKLNIKKNIHFNNISYTYPGSKKPAIVDINFRFDAGESVGIVGNTGAGKTTLVDILLALLIPSKGSIEVDGISICDKTVKEWQTSLGYVPQEIFLADTSIRENIALGVPLSEIKQSKIEFCAKLAQIDQFINNELPLKYETMVGERGVRLSGGQRQRIGIARALYHDPDILVFDEATSALDTLTEKSVISAIQSLKTQKTTIIIAHRLSTVMDCDKILFLDKGRIRSIGSYEELANTDELFKKMIEGMDE